MSTRITVTFDEVGPEVIIRQAVRIQEELGAAGYHQIDVRVPQKGYDALEEWGKDHEGPAANPALLSVPKWLTCLSGIPVSPIEETKPPKSGRKESEMDEHDIRDCTATEAAKLTIPDALTELVGTLNRATMQVDEIREKLGVSQPQDLENAHVWSEQISGRLAHLHYLAGRLLSHTGAINESL